MELVGRLTANATKEKLTDGREVATFSIAINDSFKPKGATEVKKVTTYFECSYWLNPSFAQYLKKGEIVQMSGSISANAYTDKQGQAKASLRYHVNTIKLHGGGKKNETISEPPAENIAPVDDLPF
jgi:single-strand DNA-binding protein